MNESSTSTSSSSLLPSSAFVLTEDDLLNLPPIEALEEAVAAYVNNTTTANTTTSATTTDSTTAAYNYNYNEQLFHHQQQQQQVQHGRIHKIDTQSIQRIVAGQAVTDLASAVKELVDNSLDAASQTIQIRLVNKGIDVIEVIDDGIGVPIESRPFVALPHATSKIRTFEDIYHCQEDSDSDDSDNDDNSNNSENEKEDDDEEEEEEDELPSSALTTMGFRGEALFCLANLSHSLIVSTRTTDEEIAQKMSFRNDGSLDMSSIIYAPRKVGTSVTIMKLFANVPVRQQDMIRRLKYQRSKLIDMMEGYAIYSIGVQIHVMDVIETTTTITTTSNSNNNNNINNITNNNNKNGKTDSKTLLCTPANSRNLRETVSSVLGPKFLANMSSIDIDLTSIVMKSTNSSTIEKKKKKDNDDDDDEKKSSEKRQQQKHQKHKYKLHGLISKAGTPHMRGVRQAQFFSINRRPVDLPKIARLINDTWRSFGSSSSTIGGGGSSGKQPTPSMIPSFVLQFTLPNNAFDINVSPDKRKVILTNESDICDIVQAGIIALWKSQSEGRFVVGNNHINNNNNNNNANDYNYNTTTAATTSTSVPNNNPSLRRASGLLGDFYPDPDEDSDNSQQSYSDVDDENKDDDDVSKNNEFIASRRYGFADDPTMATNREIEDRQRREQYMLELQQQQRSHQTEYYDSRNDHPNDDDYEAKIIEMSKEKSSCSDDPDHGIVLDNKLMTNNAQYQKNILITPSPAHIQDNIDTITISKNDNDNSDGQSQLHYPSKLDDLRMSWSDKKQWRDIVAKFNSSSDGGGNHTSGNDSLLRRQQQSNNSIDNNETHFQHDPTVTSYTTASPENVNFRLNIFAEQDMRDFDTRHPLQHAKEEHEIPNNNSNISKISNNRKRKSFGLEQFGFRAVKRVSDPCTESGQDDRNSIHEYQLPSIQKQQPTQQQHQQHYLSTPVEANEADQHHQTSVDTMNWKILPNRYKRIVSLPDRNDTYSTSHNDNEIVHSDRVVSNDYSGGNKVNAPFTAATHDRNNSDSKDDNRDIESKDDSMEVPIARKTTIWTSIKSTDDVVAASIREHIAMRGRRIQLRNRFHGANGSSTPLIDLLKNESTDDVSPQDEDDERNNIIALSDVKNASATQKDSQQDYVSLTKEAFKGMTTIGQFNMGFILATTQDGHLWILDQHACDEKYNFEKLCRETVIHEQRLIAPMPLELSPSEETCVLDNMDIFEKNGFRFTYDPEKPVRHRLSLTALPHSGARDGRKAVQFGKEDVAALCEILGSGSNTSATDDDYHYSSSGGTAAYSSIGGGTGVDGSGMFGNNAVRRHAARSSQGAVAVSTGETADKIIARLPKAVAMFASRACRGSIMIGKALSEKEMDRIVKRLADIEHPWNCPHGRPTMRHIGSLKTMLETDETNAACRIAGPTVTMLTQEQYHP